MCLILRKRRMRDLRIMQRQQSALREAGLSDAEDPAVLDVELSKLLKNPPLQHLEDEILDELGDETVE
jgi:hypothetical protein